MYISMLSFTWQSRRRLRENTPFTWALAMRPSSNNCNPAPDLVLSKLSFQPGGVFCSQTLAVTAQLVWARCGALSKRARTRQPLLARLSQLSVVDVWTLNRLGFHSEIQAAAEGMRCMLSEPVCSMAFPKLACAWMPLASGQVRVSIWGTVRWVFVQNGSVIGRTRSVVAL